MWLWAREALALAGAIETPTAGAGPVFPTEGLYAIQRTALVKTEGTEIED
jgi:hypothetical protein